MFRKNALFALFVIMTAGLLFFSPVTLAQDTQTVPQIETGQQDDGALRANATEWVNGLASLNLTADQRTQITDILVEYQREKQLESSTDTQIETDADTDADIDTDTDTDIDTETGTDTDTQSTELDLKSRINDQIDAVLTETQRTQFDTMRDSWWVTIENSNMNMNKDFNQGDVPDTDTDTDTDAGTDTTDIK